MLFKNKNKNWVLAAIRAFCWLCSWQRVGFKRARGPSTRCHIMENGTDKQLLKIWQTWIPPFLFFLITSWFSEAEMSKSQVRKEWWSFFPFFFKATGFKAHRFSHSSRLVVIQKKHVGSRCFERPFQTIGNSILWSYFMSSEPNNELIRPTISSVDTNKEADINSPD